MMSTVVMAHPTRARYVSELLVRLDTHAEVVWDTLNDRWDTGRRALLAHDPDATHALVLQDDALIPSDLASVCGRILQHVPPSSPVSLYMGRWRHRPYPFNMQTVVDTARQRGASFAAFGGPWWGVGVIVPTIHIEKIVANGDSPSSHKNYDIKIAQYFAAKQIPCYYTMPSVVEHREGKSLMPGRGTQRHAAWYESDTSKVDWGSGVVTPADMGVGRFPQTP